MKKQINPNVKAHLVRGAFYLLLLFAVCVTPFARGQQNTTQLPSMSSDSDVSTASHALAVPIFPTGGILWNQYNNPATQSPVSIGSQEFEPAFASLTDQAADDFVFTYPFNNVITRVRVMGEYSKGGGPASSFDVYIYGNGPGNLPGGMIAARLNLLYTGTPPDFTINLDGGHYGKVSVALEMEGGIPAAAEGAAPSLKENAVVRSVVTNDLTGLATDDLIQRPSREKLLMAILKDLQSQTDEKVTHVFFTDVVVQ